MELPEERRANPVPELTNKSGVNVYPNPTNGNINITVNTKADNIVIEVYSSTGQLVESRRVNNYQTIEVPLGRYAAGIYTVRVLIDEQSELIKVIKTE